MIEQFFGGFKSIGVFSIVLSVLILVHEWGHFITAKKLGVKVLKFSLGFGPKLFSWMHDGTEFLICLIPLGGYVKMAGDERTECKGNTEEFFSKPPGHRALIVLNGPVVNLILAYVCLAAVCYLGYPAISTQVYDVVADGPAYKAGFQPGDKIVAMDSKKLRGWIHLELLLEGKDTKPITFRISRDGKEIETIVNPQIIQRPNLFGETKNFRDIGINFDSTKIGGLVENFPAEQAGIKLGDIVQKINGREIRSWKELQGAISDSHNEKIEMEVLRDGKTSTIWITPKREKRKNADGVEKEVNIVGIGPARDFVYIRFSFGDALNSAFDELKMTTILTYRQLFRLIMGSKEAKDSVTGPIGIFYMVKSASNEGLIHVIYLLGSISAALALFNLLPVIPLDGGHLLLLAIEKVRGRSLPEKIDEYIARIGFTLIILLAIFVFYSDFSRFGWIDKIKNLFF